MLSTLLGRLGGEEVLEWRLVGVEGRGLWWKEEGCGRDGRIGTSIQGYTEL